MSFFRYVFTKKSQVTIGSIWLHVSDYDDNPFREITIVYRIVDVKRNWVKYNTYGSDGIIATHSTDINSFYAFYRKIDKAPDNILFKD